LHYVPIWFWIKGEIGTMETKPAQNIQDTFLNTARKDKSPITIYLMSGVKLSGRIRSFDKYSVVLETNNQEQLIFKHAISTVVMGRSAQHMERPGSEHRPPMPDRSHAASHGESTPPAAASEG
jgi:host factor-I protein